MRVRVAHRAPAAQAVVAGGHRDGRGDELVEPLAATGHGRDHRQAEGLRKRATSMRSDCAPGLVDQVQGDHDRGPRSTSCRTRYRLRARLVASTTATTTSGCRSAEPCRATHWSSETGVRERRCPGRSTTWTSCPPQLAAATSQADRHAGVVGGLDGGAGEAVEEARLADVGVAGEADHQGARCERRSVLSWRCEQRLRPPALEPRTKIVPATSRPSA